MNMQITVGIKRIALRSLSGAWNNDDGGDASNSQLQETLPGIQG